VIDLGPEAGAEGGGVVAVGTPEEVAGCEASHTGRFLRGLLGGGRRKRRGSEVLELDADAAGHFARVEEITKQYQITKRREGIQVRGAREHNLKNISVDIPHEQLVVITGLSGSGKSTLAFDILFAEGQRRFLDSMSTQARQYVTQMERPDVDYLDGLPPTVAIEQRLTRGGGKSTVATVTEIWQFLRLLYAKLGVQYCPECDLPVAPESRDRIVEKVTAAVRRGRVKLLANLVQARKGFHTEVARRAVDLGMEWLRVDGGWVEASKFKALSRFQEHTIDGVVAELGVGQVGEVAGWVDRALEIGGGSAKLWEGRRGESVLSTSMSCPGCGTAFEGLDPRLFSFHSPHGWCPACRGFGALVDLPGWAAEREELSMVERELREERLSEWSDWDAAKECPSCEGDRINARARAVRIGGVGITAFARSAVGMAGELLAGLEWTEREGVIARDLVREIGQRLRFLEEVGLGYLELNRGARTLSGGESQRIRLAAQLGSELQGVLYVLDEPTIGLHPRDNDRLLATLLALKAKGNSLVVVEHDDATLERADYVIDLGPGAGKEGGAIVARGDLRSIMANPESVTGRAFAAKVRHPMRGRRRSLRGLEDWIRIRGACANNLKGIEVGIPLGRLTVLTGVSGSGKSSLMRGVLLAAARQAGKGREAEERGGAGRLWEGVEGLERIEAVYEVDQSPIGKTSRSTPATYVKLWDTIRQLFAGVPLARMRGYGPGRFSFNTAGGRCEACGGHGMIKLEMSFLPTSHVPCPDCEGKRFNAATLEVEYQGRSIAGVLEMTIEEALEFFQAHPKLAGTLRLLHETGLGYLRLGQQSPTLSGGEAQRIKLVTELAQSPIGKTSRSTPATYVKLWDTIRQLFAGVPLARMRGRPERGGMLYLLEEPTIGLHLEDVKRCMEVLHRLVDEGHTVVVIEHHTHVMAEADYVIDLGPEAGMEGGWVVAHGTPEQVSRSKRSRTAPFLRKVLGTGGWWRWKTRNKGSTWWWSREYIVNMIEIEIYAAGVRDMGMIMALESELGTVPGLFYKIDSNHDIVYMEFEEGPTMTLQEIQLVFRRLGLSPRIVGSVPVELTPKTKTQKLTV